MKKIYCLLLCVIFLMSSNLGIFADSNNSEVIKNTIKSFYDAQYDAYLAMEYKDITPYLDMDKIQNQNKATTLKHLTLQRKYIDKKSYAYVEKKRFPVAFNYEDITIRGNHATVVLDLELDDNEAYPPFISSGDNILELENRNGSWKIVSHDYEGLDIYETSADILLPELKSKELYKQIDENYVIDHEKEYKNYDEKVSNGEVIPYSLPSTDYTYSGSRGVSYANSYVTNANSKFYTASVSGGDCTNFVSQCLWYGFGAADTQTDITNKVRMIPGSTYSDGWYAGSGGGSRNWEAVNYFWSYMTSSKSIDTPGPRVSVVSSISSLNAGGIMQIDFTSDGSYDHSVIMVDTATQKFAQHSSNIYRFYSDYSGTKRFLNPSYIKIMD